MNTARYCCGKTHKFKIYFNCEKCKTHKKFTVERKCRANYFHVDLLLKQYTYEAKKISCNKCCRTIDNYAEYFVVGRFQCSSGWVEADYFFVDNLYKVTVIITNAD